jgi:hypothetical protein
MIAHYTEEPGNPKGAACKVETRGDRHLRGAGHLGMIKAGVLSWALQDLLVQYSQAQGRSIPKVDMSESESERPTELELYSIGHSDHSIEAFLNLLRRHEIALVVDVRSQPYSRWVPHFNRENLAAALEAAGLRYLFMGDSLGGRPANPTLYNPGQEHLNYELVVQSPAYQAGVEKLLKLAEVDHIAIMCSEGDYHMCHRSKLVTPTLLQHGARVFHIRPDGTVIEAQPDPEQLTLL